ncbi:hypothetical protein SAMN04487760_11356 [Lachnospiraceae bacterium G41]|nr:hypothetical protein SAMN04487760_11356 [Lachnospiraceae bacterium G41]
MEFTTDIFSQFDKKWALLTAGNKESFNTMTISWGDAEHDMYIGEVVEIL